MATETIADGWMVEESRLVQKLINEKPPRRYSYWTQVGQDARSLVILGLWSTIIICVVLTAIKGWYLLLVPAVLLFRNWWILCSNVVSNSRNTPLAIGVMNAAVITHPLGNVVVGKPQMAVAELPDGRTVSVTISESLVRAAFCDAEKAEVLFLDNPRDDFPLAVGVRSIPKPALGPEDGKRSKE